MEAVLTWYLILGAFVVAWVSRWKHISLDVYSKTSILCGGNCFNNTPGDSFQKVGANLPGDASQKMSSWRSRSKFGLSSIAAVLYSTVYCLLSMNIHGPWFERRGLATQNFAEVWMCVFSIQYECVWKQSELPHKTCKDFRGSLGSLITPRSFQTFQKRFLAQRLRLPLPDDVPAEEDKLEGFPG